jgi:hypothetical protein
MPTAAGLVQKEGFVTRYQSMCPRITPLSRILSGGPRSKSAHLLSMANLPQRKLLEHVKLVRTSRLNRKCILMTFSSNVSL